MALSKEISKEVKISQYTISFNFPNSYESFVLNETVAMVSSGGIRDQLLERYPYAVPNMKLSLDVDPAIFRRFAHWLHTGQLEEGHHDPRQSEDVNYVSHLHVLFSLAIFAEDFDIPLFYNQVLEHIHVHMGPPERGISMKTLENAWKASHETSKLRTLLSALFEIYGLRRVYVDEVLADVIVSTSTERSPSSKKALFSHGQLREFRLPAEFSKIQGIVAAKKRVTLDEKRQSKKPIIKGSLKRKRIDLTDDDGETLFVAQ